MLCQLQLCIRYTSILLCGNYIYRNLSGEKTISFWETVQLLFWGLPYFIFFSFIPECAQPVTYALLPFIQVLYYKLKYKSSIHLREMLLPLSISYSLDYCIFMLSILITALTLGSAQWLLLKDIALPGWIGQSIIGLVMWLFSMMMFQPKRFKNGLLFPADKALSYYGFFLSFCVFFCIITISTPTLKNSTTHMESTFIIFFIFVLFFLLLMWWKQELKNCYLKQLRHRDFLRLEEELKDCHNTIATLKEENQDMAHLIHRDNKQVAALSFAVETYLSSIDNSPEESRQLGNQLMLELQKDMQVRQEFVSKLTTSSLVTPTGILSMDCLINYMLHKCGTYGIALKYSFPENIQDFIGAIIEEQDLITILADLLENALIATRYANGADILLEVGRKDEVFFLCVHDSGIPFTKEVLLDLGQKRHTTHKNNGGSGIGLMSTYERLQNYHASFVIDESPNKEVPYCKSVWIFFDGKGEYRLHTRRLPVEIEYLHHREDLMIE